MHVVGLVLHPQRDCGGAVASVLDWADQRGIEVLGIDTELSRLACSANPVSAEELKQRADLLVSMGGDGTMLRAMRLADGQRFPVLGVNLGKLGFLAEVDVPELVTALSAIDAHEFTTEPRLAIDCFVGDPDGPVDGRDDGRATAFNDIAVVRTPGDGLAAVAVHAGGQPFVSYVADAVIVATPTGSTAYSFSAGGPIVSPAVEALLVTPASPHSAYNRGVVVSVTDTVSLEVLSGSGKLAIEVDGRVAGFAGPGDFLDITPRPAAARVVRLGHTTFYQRARRKLGITDSLSITQ
jgi:NAD+ kinase